MPQQLCIAACELCTTSSANPAALAQVVDDWERLTAHIEADKESKEQLGWVREMYAFSIAAALQVPPPHVARELGGCL